MLTSDYAVVRALVVVLFLAMIVFDPTILHFGYFVLLFYLLWYCRS